MPNPDGTNTLVVPIQLNACHVAGSRTVADAKADFSRLPWSNGQEDFNSSTPFLGESVLSPPFQDKNFELAEGVHLHWVLPKAHRTYPAGIHNPPAAPNRWLISGDSGQWIVESDYISETTTLFNRNAITVPSKNLKTGQGQPYVYLGRQLPLKSWQYEKTPTSSSDNYFSSLNGNALTAFGYGEMSFNTFYPNCRSVFGFFDPLGTDSSTYEVLGWYSNANDDIVTNTISELTHLLSEADKNPHLLKKLCGDDKECPSWLEMLLVEGAQAAEAYVDPTEINDATINWLKGYLHGSADYYKDFRAQLLLEHAHFSINTILDFLPEADQTNILQLYYNYGLAQALNWTFDAQTGYPSTSLYYAKTTLSSGNTPTFTDVAVGPTGTQALSAYLANELGGGDTTTIESIEQGLNTLLLAGSVQNDLVDLDDNLKESEHNHSFTAVGSGQLWRIRKMKNPGGSSVPSSAPSGNSETSIAELPHTVASALNQLNQAQEAYQQGQYELETAKSQLYADWCKYMISCYPPLGTKQNYPDDDLIKEYVTWELKKLDMTVAKVGKLTKALTDIACTASGLLDQELLNAYQAVVTALAPVNQSLTTQKKDYTFELSEVPAPRYYKPKDPVVLFAADSSDNIVMPGKKAQKVSWSDSITQTTSTNGNNCLFCDLSAIPTTISKKKRFNRPSSSWSPQILQWLTSFSAEANGSNVGSADGNYASTYISDNFTIDIPSDPDKASFDFTPKSQTTLSKTQEYSGSTFVSAHTKKHMEEVLEAFLIKKYPDTVTTTTFDQKWKKIPKDSSYKAEEAGSIGHIAFNAYYQLQNKLILTQSLGGLNQAMLQQMQNMSLPIKDPIGFSGYQSFTKNICDALGKAYPSPNMDNQFMPIRAGRLALSKLAFLNYFGVENRANLEDIHVASSMKVSYAPGEVWLSPRLAQPGRLNLRWLSAVKEGTSEVEMNSHPATSPICGWLLPNYFDNSLMAYDSSGNGLGSFDFNVSPPKWEPYPASSQYIEGPLTATSDIPTQLLNVLLDIQKGNTTTVAGQNGAQSFLEMVQLGQGTISPEYFAGHDSMAILMGKPIAVVRAQMSLEIQGGFAQDQAWTPFRKQLNETPPQTDNYEQVSFPVRLGENGQLNDGLLAFWEDSTLASVNPGAANWVNNSTSNTLNLTLAQTPVKLTLLMDPHGIVHATSGILPVKTIRIPTDQYTKALRNISVNFKIRPVLTPTSQLQLSLPQEQGYTWSWLEAAPKRPGQAGTNWQSTPDFPLLAKTVFDTSWEAYLSETFTTSPTKDTVWTALLSSGWLTPVTHNPDLFKVYEKSTSIENKMKTKSFTGFEIMIIEKLIRDHLTGMTPINREAKFYKKQHLVEGWLNISPSQNQD